MPLSSVAALRLFLGTGIIYYLHSRTKIQQPIENVDATKSPATMIEEKNKLSGDSKMTNDTYRWAVELLFKTKPQLSIAEVANGAREIMQGEISEIDVSEGNGSKHGSIAPRLKWNPDHDDYLSEAYPAYAPLDEIHEKLFELGLEGITETTLRGRINKLHLRRPSISTECKEYLEKAWKSGMPVSEMINATTPFGYTHFSAKTIEGFCINVLRLEPRGEQTFGEEQSADTV